MSPPDGPDAALSKDSDETAVQRGSVACMLFESLIHHLIEKGLLTKNDALSVVQTVAEVKRGEVHGGQTAGTGAEPAMAMLQTMYLSFEALAESPGASPSGRGNVYPLRPPLHGDQPGFPRAD